MKLVKLIALPFFRLHHLCVGIGIMAVLSGMRRCYTAGLILVTFPHFSFTEGMAHFKETTPNLTLLQSRARKRAWTIDLGSGCTVAYPVFSIRLDSLENIRTYIQNSSSV
jgi:hypothetical protein